MLEALLIDQVSKKCTRHETAARARFHAKIAKNAEGTGTEPDLRGRLGTVDTARNVFRFGALLLLCGFATGCDKTHWHGCAQEGISDVATLLATGIAARGC